MTSLYDAVHYPYIMVASSPLPAPDSILPSLYNTVSEGWRTTLGVARWVCDRHGALTGIGGNRVFRAASGVQILRPRPLASRGDLRAVPPGRYGRRPRSAAAPAGCGQAEKSHADDWLRPDRGGRASQNRRLHGAESQSRMFLHSPPAPHRGAPTIEGSGPHICIVTSPQICQPLPEPHRWL